MRSAIDDQAEYTMRFLTILLVAGASIALGCEGIPDSGVATEEELKDVWHAIFRKNIPHVKRMLASKPSLARGVMASGDTLLHEAAILDRPEAITCLTKAGADVNTVNKYGETPLFCAVNYNCPESVQTLLEHGADPAITDESNATPLMAAARRGRIHVMELLLSKGAKVDQIKAKSNTTALHSAARWHQAESVSFLVAHGANVDTRDNISRTPLFHAVDFSFWQDFTQETRDHIETVNALLAAGADPGIPSITGKTPLELAESFRDKAPVVANAMREAAAKKKSGEAPPRRSQ